MAIAYFIPDQAQLLARSSRQAAGGTTSPGQQHSQQQQQQHVQQQHQQQGQRRQQQQQQQQRTGSSQFRGNISFPLSREQGAMSMSEFGCWELLAQIFCYALRIYNYNSAQRRPTVIQISFEISASGASEPEAPQQEEEEDATDAPSKQD